MITFCLIATLVYLGEAVIAPSHFDNLLLRVKEPYFASKASLGTTVKENNLEVYALTRIRHSNLEQLYGSKAIVINSYMHAREPYSVKLTHNLFEHAIRGQYSQSLACFLRSGVIIFYPFVNIDGYHAYLKGSAKEKLLMRKNLNGNQSNCKTGVAGVDINRNFPSSFNTVRQSRNPCGEQYHGQNPFSEAQAKAFQILFQNFQVLVAIDIHSYGNQWIYPYASDSTDNKLKNRKNYPLYNSVIKKLKENNSTIMSCWQSLNYIADGVYIDWAADQGAISLAYEVGRNFNSDSNIDEETTRALVDFSTIFDVLFPQSTKCASLREQQMIEERLEHPYKAKQISILIIVAIVGIYVASFWCSYILSRKKK